VRHLNIFQLYRWGAALRPLTRLGPFDTSAKELWADFYGAREALEELLQHLPIGVCRPKAEELLRWVKRSTPETFPKASDDVPQVPGIELAIVSRLASEFEAILAAELQGLATFLVSAKGVFATQKLVDAADEHFSPDVLPILTELARAEFKSAGRCLAFELPTASGFHLLRAVEATMQHYYLWLTPGAITERLPNWGTYIKKLREAKAPDRILSTLDQVREDHRNPTMHPDETLDIEQAMVLFGIGYSAITAIANEMRVRSPKE
jgi:hypothetical protein